MELVTSIDFLEDNFRVEDLSEIFKSTLKLETLEIPKRIHSGSGNIVKLFPEDSKPRLKYLKKFTLFNANPYQRIKFYPTFLDEIITAAENISYLELWDPCCGEGENIFSNFEVLSIIEKLGRESSVQEIKIVHRGGDDSDYVELFRKMAGKRNGLKLKKLEYDTFFSSQDNPPVSQVISLFNDTLEYLNIDRNCCISFVEFQEMKCLTRLYVSFCQDFNSKFVNLRKIFPVLETLHLSDIRGSEGEYFDEFFPESQPCPTIHSLHLCGLSLKMNGFNQLLRVFPNLTDFRVKIKEDGEEILRQIWSQLTQLECLRISGTIQTKDSLDCVLTGISDHSLHEIRDVVNNLEKMTTEVERREMILKLRNQHSTLPSIGN